MNYSYEFDRVINVTDEPALPRGEYYCSFSGLDIEASEMKFTIKFSRNNILYKHTIYFAREGSSKEEVEYRAEAMTKLFRNLSSQLKMYHSVSFSDYNDKVGSNIWVCVDVMGSSTYYSYKNHY